MVERRTRLRTVATPLSFGPHVLAIALRATAVTFRSWALRSTHMKTAVATGQLLERSEELARIESVLAAARSGLGTFAVVEGPAGIGKTALLAAARSAATDGGMHVLRARGTELERDFAFGVVRQLCKPPPVWRPACSGFPAPLLTERTRQASTHRSRSCTGSTGCARIWPPSARSASSSTTCTGQTPPPSVTWFSCLRAWKNWTPPLSSRPVLARRALMPNC